MAEIPNRFVVIDDDGNEFAYDLLFSFDLIESGKSYLVYTDNSTDGEGNVRIFAGTYDPASLDESGAGPVRIAPLKTEAEWQMANSMLSRVIDQLS